MSAAKGTISTLLRESGAVSIYRSSWDTKLLCIQRFVRMFAYGLSFLILVHFLTSIGIDDTYVGLFMTLTLLGDAVISFCLTLITDSVGRRRILAAGAALMSLSGIVFAVFSNYWILLFASIIGVISPSGNEIGPFKAIEESILTQLTEKDLRSDVFAWYTLFGTFGAGLGTLTCGFAIAYLAKLPSWTTVHAYRVVFVLYALLGLVKLVLALMLSKAVELDQPQLQINDFSDAETESLLSESSDDEHGPPSPTTSRTALKTSAPRPTKKSFWARAIAMVPTISPASRGILIKLICLFFMDSFASGLASPSWQTYFFTTVHSLPGQALGSLFFVTNLLATVSNLMALPIARRIGPLKTMTFTHLPSAIFLSLIPLPPVTTAGTWTAMGFLAARACTQSMDQAPRQAFLGAAVLSNERTAVLGVVNIMKTLAQASGIGCTGFLASHKLWVVMFTGAGALKASYDLLMLWMFLGIVPREEQ